MQILCEYSLFACKCEYEISYLCTFRTVQKNVSKFHTSLVLTDPLFKILTLPNLNIKHLYLKWVPNLNVPILAPQFQTNLIFEQARKCSVLKLDTGILDHWDWNTGHRGAMHGLLVHYWTPPSLIFKYSYHSENGQCIQILPDCGCLEFVWQLVTFSGGHS